MRKRMKRLYWGFTIAIAVPGRFSHFTVEPKRNYQVIEGVSEPRYTVLRYDSVEMYSRML